MTVQFAINPPTMEKRELEMKIAFDGYPLSHKNITGIGIYTYNIIKNVVTSENNNIYILNMYEACKNDIIIKFFEENNNNIHQKIINLTEKRRVIEILLGLKYKSHFTDTVDITHFLNFILPTGVNGKKIITIHDMVSKVCPETMTIKNRILLGLKLKSSAKRADQIITVSENSKLDIIRYLKIVPEKITVVPPGVDTTVFHPDYRNEQIAYCKKKYNIDGNYFLYTGTLEPRKNIKRLVEAYAKAISTRDNAPKLVLTGMNGWNYKNIYKQVISSCVEDLVIFTDYIPTEDIAVLMNGALAFVYPSIYEGFGLPPLEAMNCGTPVITSNISSLPEVVGDAALLINPFSIDDISKALSEIMNNTELRLDLKNKGIVQSKKFSWEKSSEILMGVYRDLLKES